MPAQIRRQLSTLAAILTLPAGAFAVHQLRYQLAYGGRATLELQRQGHTYLHSLVPWLACTACLLAIYIAQELLEGWFATGHAAGMAGVFGYGGWSPRAAAARA